MAYCQGRTTPMDFLPRVTVKLGGVGKSAQAKTLCYITTDPVASTPFHSFIGSCIRWFLHSLVSLEWGGSRGAWPNRPGPLHRTQWARSLPPTHLLLKNPLPKHPLPKPEAPRNGHSPEPWGYGSTARALGVWPWSHRARLRGLVRGALGHRTEPSAEPCAEHGAQPQEHRNSHKGDTPPTDWA